MTTCAIPVTSLRSNLPPFFILCPFSFALPFCFFPPSILPTSSIITPFSAS